MTAETDDDHATVTGPGHDPPWRSLEARKAALGLALTVASALRPPPGDLRTRLGLAIAARVPGLRVTRERRIGSDAAPLPSGPAP